jgi:uncharacterized protein (TIGR03118 family)
MIARAAAVALAVASLGGGGARAVDAYAVRTLASDRTDRQLVNAWGLAASPTGPWWTANEARDASTVYAGDGSKQRLTVAVQGGPTGIVYNGTDGFRVSAGGRSAPARFIYAGEDGTIRAWSPVVPHGWSSAAEIAVDDGARAAVFRGLAIGGGRLYATDFHNARVDVFDARWRRVDREGAFVDRTIPAWYAPFGLQVIGRRVFVTYVWRAPVNGNDAPTGGYVDEFDLRGRLVARVGRMGALNAPWGLALAPQGFGRFGGALLVGNFGDGHVNAFRRNPAGVWTWAGALRGRDGRPLSINGLWGLAFGNGALAGPRTSLFFAAGPHRWRGATESEVHGLIGTIEPA